MTSPIIDRGLTTGHDASRDGHARRWPVPLPAEGAIVYAGIRVISLIVAAFLLRRGGFAVRHWSLTHWIVSGDGGFYLKLAEHGYDYHAPLTVAHLILFGFFPGYPAAIAALSLVPGIAPAVAGFVITIGSGLVAAWGLARLVTALTGSRRIALIAVALWASAPGSLVLSMIYTEALYCALAIWTLCMLIDRRWLTAAALTAAAGLVRFDAITLSCAVWFAAIAAIITAVRARERPAVWWRPAVAMAVAPAGLVAYLGIVAIWTHRLDGWFWVEETYWHQGSSDGLAMIHALWHAFVGLSDFPHTMVALAVAAAIVLTAWTFAEPMPAVLRVYTVAVVLDVLTQNAAYFPSKLRYLLPAVLLAVPLARMLAGVRLQVVVPLLGLLAVASTWFGLYITVIAHQAP